MIKVPSKEGKEHLKEENILTIYRKFLASKRSYLLLKKKVPGIKKGTM